MKYRFETFGGIIASEDPPFLAFVDREYMRGLGLRDDLSWSSEDETIGLLSAPTEVHFAITNRCQAGCPHCYMGAGSEDPGELSTESVKRALDILAKLKVFHVALGGGEALERADLFEIADHARARGLVPNLTVSGLGITREIAHRLKGFGQINVSVDAGEWGAGGLRPSGMFEAAKRAIDHLAEAGLRVGINAVIGKRNYDAIPGLFQYAEKKRITEIEFLRLKPSGRGKSLYTRERTTHQQNTGLFPLLAKMSEQHGITAKIDCSLVPMFCYHKPPLELLEATATYGCEAGNVIMGVRSNGAASGCSFLEGDGTSLFDLHSSQAIQNQFAPITSWTRRAVEPCRSCDYLHICKGGCRGVAEYVTGNFDAPDPDCPFVVAYSKCATP